MVQRNLVNAVDVFLASGVDGVVTSIVVDDALPLPAVPFYLVVDPFDDGFREYMECTAVATNALTVVRGLAGSVNGVASPHLAGATVRIAIVAQHVSDLWDGIVPQTFLHADLTDVSPDQHHTRYTDGEAVAAVGDPGAGVYLPLSGGLLSGPLDAPDISVNRIKAANPGNDLHIRDGDASTKLLWRDSDGQWEFTAPFVDTVASVVTLRNDTAGVVKYVLSGNVITFEIVYFASSGTTLFTLPNGIRPWTETYYSAVWVSSAGNAKAEPAAIRIRPSGAIFRALPSTIASGEGVFLTASYVLDSSQIGVATP